MEETSKLLYIFGKSHFDAFLVCIWLKDLLPSFHNRLQLLFDWTFPVDEHKGGGGHLQLPKINLIMVDYNY